MVEIRALILGIIQGLTEFLPVSSSGHLNVFPWIFNWEITESFDVALHLGTLLAICIFFFKDWLKLIRGGFNKVIKKEDSVDGKIFWYLVIATIPAGILSLVLDKISEKIVGTNLNLEMALIAGALILMGIILYLVDKKAKSEVKYEEITLKQSILIGITMTVARGLKVDRESAARYSFLLATPITAAAVLVSLGDFVFNMSFVIGVLASFIVGLLIIKFLLNYLRKGSFKVFAIYRIIFGLIMKCGELLVVYQLK